MAFNVRVSIRKLTRNLILSASGFGLLPLAVADDSLGVAAGFNAFIKGDFQSQWTDMQGRLAAGGSVNLDGYGLASTITLSAEVHSLVAGGDITFANGMIYAGSVITTGSAAGLGDSVRDVMQVGSTVEEVNALPIDFAAQFTYLSEISNLLASAIPTGTTTFQWGGVNFVGDCESTIQVFDVDGAALRSSSSLSLSCIPEDATVVFNIDGLQPGLENIGLATLQPMANKILWNFYEAESLHFASVGVEGSILAPGATIASPWGYVNGTVIAKSWSGYMELHHVPFEGEIASLLPSEAPTIISPPVTVGYENTPYIYDVEAIDEDMGDVLTYTIDSAPLGFSIESDTGVISWLNAEEHVGAVAEINQQCYVVPTGSVSVIEEGDPIPDERIAVISPLFKRVKEALEVSSEYVARESVAWNPQDRNCIGCHIQTQSLLGLETSIDKIEVDEDAIAFLVDKLFDNRRENGTITSHEHTTIYLNNQTSLALWSLTFYPDHSYTFDARINALNFFNGRVVTSGALRYWQYDHDTGWMNNNLPVTALVSQAGTHLLDDLLDLTIEPTEQQLATLQAFEQSVPFLARYFLNNYAIPNADVTQSAFRLIGLAELKRYITDVELLIEVNSAIEYLDTYLRSIQLEQGGWPYYTYYNYPSPVASAWVGIALNFLKPGLTDPVVTRNIEYLLNAQFVTTDGNNGTWQDPIFAQTRLATTSLVMAYLPIALDFLGNPDLNIKALSLTDQGDLYELSATVSNRGIKDITSNSTIHFYAGADATGTYLGSTSVPALKSGESAAVSLALTDVTAVGVGIFAEVIPSSEVEECEIGNNSRRAAIIRHRVTDQRGLFDTQMYSLTVEDTNSSPVITSSAEFTHQQGQVKSLQVKVADNDIGDASTFELVDAPNGIFINPQSGQILVDGEQLEPGEYSFTVRVTDLRGGMDEQIIALTIAENLPPEIVSTPVQQVLEGAQYQYPVKAIDPNNDELKYSIVTGTPAVVIENVTGLTTSYSDSPLESIRNQNAYCEREPTNAPFEAPTLKWHWSGSNVNAGYSQVMAAPIVVQLNDDNGDGFVDLEDTPDVVFTSYSANNYYSPGVLRAVSGSDGEEIWASDVLPTAFYSPAAADIDGDGLVEIVIGGGHQRGAKYLLAYENDGTLKWQVSTDRTGTPYIADINADGTVEIIYGGAVFDASGNLMWGKERDGMSLAFDVDLDGNQEVFIAGNLYTHQGDLIWSYSLGGISWGNFAAIGNFDSDDYPEIVLKSNINNIVILDNDGSVLAGPVSVPGGGGGAVTLADMDLDGWPEIGIAGASNYVIFESDLTIKWQSPTQDLTSYATGSTVFDFDGDGRAEIIYADEINLRVYDALDQKVLLEIPNSSGTLFEYPVVSDIDNDGHAELIVVANNSYFAGVNGVRVFESANDSWVSTRSIWNQYHYHITNINDDGTVPQHEEPSWLTHNTYRLNTFADRSALALADLAPFDLAYNDTTQSLSAVIYNRGLVATDGDVTVNFYNGDPQNGGVLIGENSLSTLSAGASVTTAVTAAPEALLDEIFVEVVNAGSDECITENNITSARKVVVSAVDEGGLSDEQTFLLSVVNQNDFPSIISAANTTVAAGQVTTVQVEVSDPDLGDAFTYTLSGEPTGVRLNARSGQLTLDTSSLAEDVYTFTVRVEDLAGAFAEQIFVLTVTTPDNLAPEFVSTPSVSTSALSVWAYTAQAVDPDGDAIQYGLDTKPFGMTIDGVTGDLQWEPSFEQLGDHIVDVVALDERGASTHQRFIVSVSDPYAGNLPPQITSQPQGSAVAGVQFVYNLIAVDPDQDRLSYTLTNGVGNMALDVHGQFTWTPDVAMIGRTFVISISVTDGRGGSATQQIRLPVNEPVNHPPSFVSEPETQILLGDIYTYQTVAEDADGDAVTYQFGGAKPNGMTMSSAGFVQWEPAAGQANQAFEVVIEAADARGVTATQTFWVAVNVPQQPNANPYFVSAPTSPAFIGQTYAYQALAKDADNDALTYSLVQPLNTDIQMSADGLLTWVPTAEQEGEHTVAIAVSDGKAVITQTYTLAVVPAPQTGENHYPEIISVPASELLAGSQYSYQVIATDPDNDPLSFELLNSTIAEVTLSTSGLLSWQSTLEQTGIQEFRVKVSDGELAVVQTWTVAVWDEYPPLRLFLDVSPAQVSAGDTVTITVATTGGSEAPTKTLFVDGFEVLLDNNNQAVVPASAFGIHHVVATAVAGEESLESTDQFLVLDPSDVTPPTAEIQTPEETAIITAPTPILGSVQDDNLAKYELFVAPKGTQQWQLIASGEQTVSDAELATFDPTMMLNGTYSILLLATDANGQTAQDSVTVIVDGEMKVGHFSITFEDVSIDLAGIPVRVTRTYDTRRKAESLDFGYGWSVDYQNVRIQESRALGFSWQNNYYRNGFFGDWCIQPNGDPMVTIRLPDGQVERFKAKANPECSSLVATVYATLTFEPQAGTYSTLEQNDYGQLRLTNGNIVDLGDENTYENGVDPHSYTLTTKDGMIYHLDQNFGIRRIEEPGGNYVTYTDNGIVHSAGYAVDFERDAKGRIVALVLPDGRRRDYAYGLMGDLMSVTDFSGDETTFDYLSRIPHYLDEIVDPRGVTATRMEYDEDGRLIAMIDAEGNRVEYDHDIEGRTSLIKDARGNQTLYVYDDSGRVLLETNALGETISRTYNQVGDVLTETNHLGETRSWTYDDRGNTLTETDPLGNTTSYTYDDQNQIVSETNALGITSYTNTYNNRARKLSSTTDALGNTTVFHWDVGVGNPDICQTGNSRGYTDALGNQHIFKLVCLGPLAGTQNGTVDANGVTTTYGLDSAGRRTSEKTTRTELNGNTVELITRYEYDAEDRIIKTTLPDGTVTRTEYNNIDQVTAEVDAEGRRTEYVYDDRGQQTQVLHHDGTTESKTYDAAGNLLTETDRLGRVTTYEYDANNRQILVTYSDGTSMQTEYDAAGRVVATIDAMGARTETEYDAAGRRVLTRDPIGNETSYEYDVAGRMTAMVDALGRRVEYQYNDIDQRIATVYPNSTSVGTDYDALSRKTGQTDQAGIQTQYQYDAMGRLIEVIDTLGQETLYGYDEQGNKVSQMDAEGRETRWEYDAMGRVTKRILPMGQEETFTYDSLGLRTSHTDFNGATTVYAYDNSDRVASIVYEDGSSETFSYDVLGNRTEVTQTSVNGDLRVTAYAYDSRNRLAVETQADGTSLNYTYDDNGNRTQLQVVQPIGATTTTDYAYDLLNRLVSVTSAEGITSYGYDAVGNRTSISYPNGTSQVYSYDNLNRLTQLQTYDGSGALVEQYDYTLHATGRRTQVDELDGRSTVYSYDDLYRLTSEFIADASAGNYSASFTYDAVGNRLSQTVNGDLTSYTYDDNDRLQSAGVNTYVYDNNGNTLSSLLETGTVDYTYNSKNQMVSADSANGVVSYAYNIDGIRTQAGDTLFIVDSNRSYAQVLIEDRPVDDVVYTYGDDLISQTRGGAAYFYHYDGLGSTRALSDALGDVTDRYDYEAFGEVLNQAGATENSYLFAGEQFDGVLDQYYLRARYYGQGIGRFTQMDTWMGRNHDPVSLHKYLYAGNDPVLMIDPSGYSFRSTSALGRAVEAEVNAQYMASHPECSPPLSACLFGRQMYFPGGFLKPDIMNFSAKLMNEIKPLTPGGISGGITQIKLYSATYGSLLGMLPDDYWTPAPAPVSGYLMYFVNVDGIIFYSTDDTTINALAAAGATIANVRSLYKNNSYNMNAVKALGAGAVITAGINIALKMRAAQTVMMPATMGLVRF